MSIEVIDAFHLRRDGSFVPFKQGIYFRNFWGWVTDQNIVLFTTEADQAAWHDGLEDVKETLALLGHSDQSREYTHEQQAAPYFELRRSKFPEIVGYVHELPFPAQPHLDMRPEIYHWQDILTATVTPTEFRRPVSEFIGAK